MMDQDPRERQRRFRRTCGKFATGITILMVKQGPEIHGMTANAFMSVSLEPLLVAVSVSHLSKMHAYLAADNVVFTISVLQARQRMVAELFGRPHHGQAPAPALSLVDRAFPVVADAAAWFLCHKQHGVEAGDHTIVVAGVDDFGERDAPPLVFYRGEYFSQLREEPEDELLEFLLLEQ